MIESLWKWPAAFLCGLLALAGGAAAYDGHVHTTATPAKAARAELGAGIAVAPDGVWHAVTLCDGQLVLHRSPDAGQHWMEVSVVNRVAEAIAADGENRPRIAFAHDGAVLVSWARRFEERFTGDVRFARAADGVHFDPPVTVHRDDSITGHSFNTMRVLRDGRVIVAWIDGRDRKAAKQAGTGYRGSAIYTAVSDDGGRSFRPELKVADHSCECCRLALGEDVDGRALLLWRHVFEPNERDHAIATLDADGRVLAVERATFDRWQIDACPHHGPSIAVAPDGTRHAVWFNAGRVYYGRLADGAVTAQRTVGGSSAAHADIAVSGTLVIIVWKEFDGENTVITAMSSRDGGKSWSAPRKLASTADASDSPQLIEGKGRAWLSWNSKNEGLRLMEVGE